MALMPLVRRRWRARPLPANVSRGYASVGDVDPAKRSPPFAREF